MHIEKKLRKIDWTFRDWVSSKITICEQSNCMSYVHLQDTWLGVAGLILFG